MKKSTMKKAVAYSVLGCMALSTTACSSKNKNTTGNEVSNTAVDTYTSTQAGFGGDVTVTLSVKDGKVESLLAEGVSETETIGGKAIITFNDEVFSELKGKDLVSLDLNTIDSVSGATVTSTAVLTAAKTALKEALGLDADTKATIEDQTVEVSVPGHAVTGVNKINVTFKDNKIEAIEVKESCDTPAIFATVENNMIPRIIENQSLSVDTITGATVSSNSIKNAIATAITNAGGDSSEWYTEIEKSDKEVVLEGYDVIVVGLGGSGITSYISAAENGATVFGFDSAAKVGGTSSNVTGPMAINSEIKVAENNGEKFVDEEELIADWLEYCEGDAKEEMVRLFVSESGKTMDWLINNYGFEFGNMSPFVNPKMWKAWAAYTCDKEAAFSGALETAKAMNEKNDYMTELTGQSLLTDEAGKVIGVQAEYYDGTTYKIYGKSVILATGGYIGNNKMTTEYIGGVWNTEAMLQNNGAGISMATSVGGDTYMIDVPPMTHIAQTANIIRDDSLTADEKAVLTSFVLKGDAMFVDGNGNRFMNEAGNVAFDCWKAGTEYYAIYSASQMESYKEDGMEVVAAPMFMNQGGTLEANTPIETMDHILTVGEENGIVYKADTIEELANMLGMDGLAEQVAAYNGYVAGNEADPFGKDASLMSELTGDGPFYAVKGSAYVYGTCGGLNINEDLNVLDENGDVIEGLYAVGQESMGVLLTNKNAYVTYGGAAQGWVLTSGRLAGKNAAQYSVAE